eukprot:gb/GEZN01010702.1/.p1 GENE.gb/GEZN01010702.1/~~gb/GEZN01010702.1/.p1  ORF type:complete len:249 (+),score=21.53 gb/GEZN01010702.1/:38-784(+)
MRSTGVLLVAACLCLYSSLAKEPTSAVATFCLDAPSKEEALCEVQQVGYMCVCDCNQNQDVIIPNLQSCDQCSRMACEKKWHVCKNTSKEPFCKDQYDVCETMQIKEVQNSCYHFESHPIRPNASVVSMAVVLNCASDRMAWTASLGRNCNDQIQALEGDQGECLWSSFNVSRVLPINGTPVQIQGLVNVTIKVTCVYSEDKDDDFKWILVGACSGVGALLLCVTLYKISRLRKEAHASSGSYFRTVE